MIEELVLDKVKLYRMRNGYTQTDMAELLGYKSKSGYNNIETGKVKMSLQQMAEIIKILGIPLLKSMRFLLSFTSRKAISLKDVLVVRCAAKQQAAVDGVEINAWTKQV